MHFDYVVTLKRENAHRTDMVSFFLLVFSFLAFCIVQVRNGFSGFLSIATIVIMSSLLVNIYALRKKKEMHFRNGLLATGLFWLGMPYFQWMFILFVLFALLESQAKYPLEIGFHGGGVVINTLFKKKILWTDLQSVLLKDGMLSLDFRDNTLIQKEVPDDDEPDADEDEFNEYCRGKILNLS